MPSKKKRSKEKRGQESRIKRSQDALNRKKYFDDFARDFAAVKDIKEDRKAYLLSKINANAKSLQTFPHSVRDLKRLFDKIDDNIKKDIVQAGKQNLGNIPGEVTVDEMSAISLSFMNVRTSWMNNKVQRNAASYLAGSVLRQNIPVNNTSLSQGHDFLKITKDVFRDVVTNVSERKGSGVTPFMRSVTKIEDDYSVTYPKNSTLSDVKNLYKWSICGSKILEKSLRKKYNGLWEMVQNFLVDGDNEQFNSFDDIEQLGRSEDDYPSESQKILERKFACINISYLYIDRAFHELNMATALYLDWKNCGKPNDKETQIKINELLQNAYKSFNDGIVVLQLLRRLQSKKIYWQRILAQFGSILVPKASIVAQQLQNLSFLIMKQIHAEYTPCDEQLKYLINAYNAPGIQTDDKRVLGVFLQKQCGIDISQIATPNDINDSLLLRSMYKLAMNNKDISLHNPNFLKLVLLKYHSKMAGISQEAFYPLRLYQKSDFPNREFDNNRPENVLHTVYVLDQDKEENVRFPTGFYLSNAKRVSNLGNQRVFCVSMQNDLLNFLMIVIGNLRCVNKIIQERGLQANSIYKRGISMIKHSAKDNQDVKMILADIINYNMGQESPLYLVLCNKSDEELLLTFQSCVDWVHLKPHLFPYVSERNAKDIDATLNKPINDFLCNGSFYPYIRSWGKTNSLYQTGHIISISDTKANAMKVSAEVATVINSANLLSAFLSVKKQINTKKDKKVSDPSQLELLLEQEEEKKSSNADVVSPSEPTNNSKQEEEWQARVARNKELRKIYEQAQRQKDAKAAQLLQQQQIKLMGPRSLGPTAPWLNYEWGYLNAVKIIHDQPTSAYSMLENNLKISRQQNDHVTSAKILSAMADAKLLESIRYLWKSGTDENRIYRIFQDIILQYNAFADDQVARKLACQIFGFTEEDLSSLNLKTSRAREIVANLNQQTSADQSIPDPIEMAVKSFNQQYVSSTSDQLSAHNEQKQDLQLKDLQYASQTFKFILKKRKEACQALKKFLQTNKSESPSDIYRDISNEMQTLLQKGYEDTLTELKKIEKNISAKREQAIQERKIYMQRVKIGNIKVMSNEEWQKLTNAQKAAKENPKTKRLKHLNNMSYDINNTLSVARNNINMLLREIDNDIRELPSVIKQEILPMIESISKEQIFSKAQTSCAKLISILEKNPLHKNVINKFSVTVNTLGKMVFTYKGSIDTYMSDSSNLKIALGSICGKNIKFSQSNISEEKDNDIVNADPIIVTNPIEIMDHLEKTKTHLRNVAGSKSYAQAVAI